MISIAVSTFKLFAGGFWVVRIILFTYFTYLFSCASTFRVPKLLAVVAMEGIGNISVELRYHVPNFKFKWGFRGIEGKDVGVGVNKSVIFFLVVILFTSGTYCFLRLRLISSMEQKDRKFSPHLEMCWGIYVGRVWLTCCGGWSFLEVNPHTSFL